MSDPTKENRKVIGKALNAIGSPLGQSLNQQYQKEKEQLAVDEANNLVMQRQAPVLPQDAQAFVSPVTTQAPAQEQAFVNPAAPAQDPTRAPASPVSAPAAPSLPGIPNQDAELNKVYDTADGKITDLQAQEDVLRAKRDEEIAQHQKMQAEDEESLKSIEPKELFAGKSTWQKILGGVGMFLGSITPEGARNVANMINKEIERDIDLQKTNIKLKMDKNDRRFQALVQKYGSQEAALIAKKKDAYTMLGLHTQKLMTQAKNAETRARLAQGYEQIDIQRQGLGAQLMNLSLKAKQDAGKYSIPGYTGAPLDPATKREFTNMLSSADTIRGSLSALSEIVKGTGDAIPFTQSNDRAKQYVNDVQLQLKEIKKLGVLSGSDSVRLDNYISSPSLFKSDARMQADIAGVNELVNKAIAAQEKRLGLSKQMPRDIRGKI